MINDLCIKLIFVLHWPSVRSFVNKFSGGCISVGRLLIPSQRCYTESHWPNPRCLVYAKAVATHTKDNVSCLLFVD